jgi:arabinofuranosyltransferase
MKTSRLFLLLALCSALFSALLYLGWSYGHGSLGFPLDDAWIHQTYARNLVRYGQFAYVPGQPSAGSTAPLWTLLLSVGYFLQLDFKIWTYCLGFVFQTLTAWAAYRLASRLWPQQEKVALFAGLFCALEWHLVWAAFSGMETILFILFALLLMERYLAHASPISIGLLGGLLTVTRPEGIVLYGLIVLDALRRYLCSIVTTRAVIASEAKQSPRRKEEIASSQKTLLAMIRAEQLRSIFAPSPKGAQPHLPGLLGLLFGFALLLLPYLLFNLTTSGLPFPNTFYAKQAEYRAEIVGISLAVRLWRVTRPTIVGAQVLLLPGFAFAIYRTIREKRMEAALPLGWWAVTLALYAWRLPKDYQHGRYLIPTVPILAIFGSWGTLSLLRLDSRQTIVRALSRAMSIATLVLLLLFWIIGARAYAADVGFIEGEMVAVARWLEAHTPSDVLIAVHDIGAVGYLVDRPLLDLAGLITPEVVPFIADEVQLLAFMEEKGADYVVFFPDWSPAYARMSQDPRLQPVYRTGYTWTLRQGHANMTVYETHWDGGSD